MSGSAQKYSHIERPLSTLLPILATQRGIDEIPSLRISSSISDYKVSENEVVLHPSFATSGDPVSNINKVLDVFEELRDKQSDKELLSEKAIKEAKSKSKEHLGFLQRKLSSEEFQSFIEEILEFPA